jgi:RNA polymerase sigma-70 factor, ECF subfamily
MDENYLIESARQGDLDAFNRLVLAYQQQAYNLALRLLGEEESAQDATQQSFISAYENIRTFRGGSFRAWVLRIVTNNCYDELRRRKRRPTAPLNPLNSEDGEEVEESAWMADEGSPSPEEHYEHKELEAAIQGCINALPQEFRAVVVLVDLQGMDYQEASRVIQSPLGTVRSRLARARQRLQDCLRGAGELLPDQYRLKDESSP